MAEPGDGPMPNPQRRALGRRLYVRIYLAQLASLMVASFLFGVAHVRFGAVPMSRVGMHLGMMLVLMAIALVVAIMAFPVV